MHDCKGYSGEADFCSENLLSGRGWGVTYTCLATPTRQDHSAPLARAFKGCRIIMIASRPKSRREGKKWQYSTQTRRRRTDSTFSRLETRQKFTKPTARKPSRLLYKTEKSANTEEPISLFRKKDTSEMTTTKRVSATVKNVTLRQSFQIQRSLNFTELLPALIHPDLRFLRREELDHILRLPTDTQKANELLLVLARKSSLVASKFLVGLWLTREHLGHEELFCNIFPQVPEDRAQDIVQLCKSLSSSSSLQRPPAFIELQGDLTDAKFLKVQSHLWELFGRGEYNKIAELTSQLRTSPSSEWAIVGMWFESMNCVFIHECKDHQKCVAELLKPALEKCRHPTVTNQSILEGRIFLRMSQVFLTRGEKAIASQYSEQAKELLSLTRGYDRAKLFLREAKVFSALSLTPRKEVERMYQFALDNFDEHHACCRPTAHLSLAAFYLHISFGSKPEPNSPPPTVTNEDIRKAKSHLEAVQDVFLPSMRKCEQSLLLAELLRLEGNLDKAIESFQEAAKMSQGAKLYNLVSVAEHRSQLARLQREKGEFLDNIVVEIVAA